MAGSAVPLAAQEPDAASAAASAKPQSLRTRFHDALSQATTATEENRFEDAHVASALAVTIAREALAGDADNPDTQWDLDLSAALAVQASTSRLHNNHGEALGYLVEAVDLQIARLQNPRTDDADTSSEVYQLAERLEELGRLYEFLGNAENARSAYRQLLALMNQEVEPSAYPRLEALHDVAALLIRQGAYDDALDISSDGLQTALAAYGVNNRYVDRFYIQILSALMLSERTDEALQAVINNFEGLREAGGVDHPETIAAVQGLTRTLEERGLYEEAASFYGHLAEYVLEQTTTEEQLFSRVALETILEWLRLLREAESVSEAESLLGLVLSPALQAYDNDVDAMLPFYWENIFLLVQQERWDVATQLALAMREHYDQKIAVGDMAGLDADGVLANIDSVLVYLDNQAGNLDRAESRLLPLYDSMSSRDPVSYARLMAIILNGGGYTAEAEEYAREAYRTALRLSGHGSSNAVSQAALLANILTGIGRADDAAALLDQITQSPAYDFLPFELQRTVRRRQIEAWLELPERRAMTNEMAIELWAGELVVMANQLPGESFNDESRPRELEELREVAKLTVDALWYGGEWTGMSREDRAFVTLQMASASELDIAVADAALRANASRNSPELAAQVQRREAVYREWLGLFDRQLELVGNFDPEVFEERLDVVARMIRLDDERGEIDTLLQAELPEFSTQRLPEALVISEARDLLQEGEAMLLLVSGPRGTHSFAINGSGHEWSFAERDIDETTAMVRSLQWDLGAIEQIGSEAELPWLDRPLSSFDRNAAHMLYSDLIQPVEGALDGADKVYVVSIGATSALPLSILVTESPEGDDADAAALRQTAWLGDRYAFVTLPSVNALRYLRTIEHDRSGASFLGFGAPALAPVPEVQQVLSEDAGTGDRGLGRGVRSSGRAQVQFQRSGAGLRLADPASLSAMASLPGTRTELLSIAQLLGADDSALYLAEDATESAFKSAPMTGLDVLLIATHGLLASQAGPVAQPGLVFTPPDVATMEDDGYLTAEEIAGLVIEADWVILSACNTAAGSGEPNSVGLSGLARAFIFAGSRNLLVSHWPVLDSVAPGLTTEMLQRAQLGDQSRARALQEAMRMIRDDNGHDGENIPWSHPRAWAPFVLVGEGS